MGEQIADGNVMHRPVRRPEPGQRLVERANDGLRRGDGNVALVTGAAEKDDCGVCHGRRWVQGDCPGGVAGSRLSVLRRATRSRLSAKHRLPATDYPISISARRATRSRLSAKHRYRQLTTDYPTNTS